MDDELTTLRAIGDRMQSSLDRILATLETRSHDIPALGYETGMAIVEGQRAIERWTEARRLSRV